MKLACWPVGFMGTPSGTKTRTRTRTTGKVPNGVTSPQRRSAEGELPPPRVVQCLREVSAYLTWFLQYYFRAGPFLTYHGWVEVQTLALPFPTSPAPRSCSYLLGPFSG